MSGSRLRPSLDKIVDKLLASGSEEDLLEVEEIRNELRDSGVTKNSLMMTEFSQYCYDHPEQRFWQALRNWSKWAAVYVAKNDDHPKPMDTYYWTRKNGM